MEIGQFCRLDISLWDVNPATPSKGACESLFTATVTGYIIGKRRHVEEAERVLYYFHTTAVDDAAGAEGSATYFTSLAASGGGVAWRSTDDGVDGGASPSPVSSVAATAAWHLRSANGGSEHWRNELSATTQGFASSAGYRYSFDGWYEEVYLYPIGTGEPALAQVPAEWLLAMEQSEAACEVRLLCYAFRPWFDSPFHTLKYLAYPERNMCYSVWLCHRCLSPFFSQWHLAAHLEGYCAQRDPPGTLIYADGETGLEVRHMDGARHLHYGRCLSLLGKAFIESKVLANDADIYEYFVVTLPRSALPFVPGDVFSGEGEFQAVAATFDAAGWSGRVVAGYVSRLKHTPHHTLSCIVSLPIFQQRRLASFLLDVAYTLMAERQRQCGCRRYCGDAQQDGGAISKPFSPHGQALLLSYWRRALLRTLLRRQEQRREQGSQAGAATVTDVADEFTSVKELAQALDIPIAVDDLRFLLLNDDCAFYGPREGGAVAAPGRALTPSTAISVTGANCRSSCDAKARVARPPEYRLLLVFDSARVHRGSSSPHPSTGFTAVFKPECMRRDGSGRLVYNRSLFHY